MSADADQLDRKLREAARMPPGRAQIAAIEEAVRYADARNQPGLRYTARIHAVRAHLRGGEPGNALVPFAWCLAAREAGTADPAHDHALFWSFKGIVSALRVFPEVPLDRTVAVLDDMERRYRLAGHTLGPVHEARCFLAHQLGDRETAREQYRLWCAAPRGEMSDCAACEATSKVRHLVEEGRDEDAVAVVAPVLDGTVSCDVQPHTALTALLLPFVRTGRLDEAADAHRRGYRAVQGDRGALMAVCRHIRFCALTGNEARAVELVQRHIGWLDAPPTPAADMEFCAAAAHALRRSRERADGAVRRGGALVGADELAGRALELAARFDARNGTARSEQRIRAVLTAAPLVDRLPLSGAVRRADRLAPVVAVPAAPYDLPASPEELADLAERQVWLRNQRDSDLAWARFDRICPEPAPVLQGRRLAGSGGQHMARGDFEAALEAWTEALAVLDEVDEIRAHAVRQRVGVLLCRAGEADDGLRLVRWSGAVIEAAGSPDQRCDALLQIARTHRIREEAADALAAARRAAQLAEADGASDVARACAALAVAESAAEQGPDHRDEATSQADRAIALFSTIGPAEALRDAQFVAGRERAAAQDLVAAYDLLGAAAQCADQGNRARALRMRGFVALDLNRPDLAVEALADAAAVLTAAGEDARAAHVALELVDACLAAGRPEQAAEAAEDAVAVLSDAGALATAKCQLARAYHHLGRSEQALPLVAEVVEAESAGGDLTALGHARAVEADILRGLGRHAEAARCGEQAARAFATAGDGVRELHCRRRAAVSWLRADETELSLAGLEAAERCAAAMDASGPWSRRQLAALRHDGARILFAAGQPGAALERAASAAELFRSLDALREVAVVEKLRARLEADLGS